MSRSRRVGRRRVAGDLSTCLVLDYLAHHYLVHESIAHAYLVVA